MPSNYGGLNWDSNTFVYDVGNYTNLYGNSVTFPSDPNAVYNGFGALTINVTSPSAIILGDASFLGWGQAIQCNLIHRQRCLLRDSSTAIP